MKSPGNHQPTNSPRCHLLGSLFKTKQSLLLLSMFAALFLHPPNVLARTIAVPANAPSIKSAMIQARRGDIILVSCGVYREFDIMVKPGVSLWSGTLQPDCVTIDAEQKGRCLLFSGADSTTSIVGFTLRGGQALNAGNEGQGGAIHCQNSAPRITRCVFTDNLARQGGALAVEGKRGPVLDQSRFFNNQARAQGGAIYWQGLAGQLHQCTIEGNIAGISGGAVAGLKGQIKISDSLLRDNIAGNAGGALSLIGTMASITGSVLSHNQGGITGGAILAQDCSPIMKHCTLHANVADGDGTVMNLLRSDLNLTTSLITGSSGSLFVTEDSAPELQYCNIYNGQKSAWPAALASQGSKSGNKSADPLYCDSDGADFHVRQGSPCLGETGELIMGALGQGCGAQFPSRAID